MLKLIKGRHNSPYYYIRGSVRGLRIDESTGCRERAQAEEVRIKREAQLLHQSIHGAPTSITFAEATIDYLDNGGDPTHLEPILHRIGRLPLAAIAQDTIDRLAKSLKPHASPATLNRHVYTPISAVLHHVARKRWCDKPTLARPKQPPSRIRYITHAEAQLLIHHAAPHLRPLLIFLLSTGARLSEALYLDWSDVDLERAHVTFRPTDLRSIKTDEARGVPLPPEAITALSSLPWPATGPVFRRPAGKLKTTGRLWLPYETRKNGGGQIKTSWATMLRKAKITNFTPHDCRHTWATWHYAANRDISALMALGGWKTPSMVFRYTHINSAHLAPGQRQLWGKSGDRSPPQPPNPLTSHNNSPPSAPPW